MSAPGASTASSARRDRTRPPPAAFPVRPAGPVHEAE